MTKLNEREHSYYKAALILITEVVVLHKLILAVLPYFQVHIPIKKTALLSNYWAVLPLNYQAATKHGNMYIAEKKELNNSLYMASANLCCKYSGTSLLLPLESGHQSNGQFLGDGPSGQALQKGGGNFHAFCCALNRNILISRICTEVSHIGFG